MLLPLHLSKTHKRLSLAPVCSCPTTLITVGCLKTDKTRFLLPFTSGPDHEQEAAVLLLHEHLFNLFYLFTCHTIQTYNMSRKREVTRRSKRNYMKHIRAVRLPQTTGYSCLHQVKQKMPLSLRWKRFKIVSHIKLFTY